MTTPAEVFDLSGSVAWVTGSTRGIGLGIARHLVENGASVVVHGRDPVDTARVAGEIGAPHHVTGDVRRPEDTDAMVKGIVEALGRLDIVVANVGAAFPGEVAGLDPQAWRNTFAVNLDGVFHTARAAHPHLAANGGSLITVSATAATSPTPGFAAYGAAKAAVEHLTRTLAAEWGPVVRVNCVSPGIVLTEGSARALFGGDENKVARVGSTTAVDRVGSPEDIAWAVHYLVSDAASYVSGHVLTVDGGRIEGPADRVRRAIEDT